MPTIDNGRDSLGRKILWKPLSPPQSLALACIDDEVFYGGAKGGGKSDLIVIRPLAQVNNPSFRALILREKYDETEELINRASKYYSRLPSKPHWNGEWMEWRFPNPNNRTGAGGAYVKFGYCRTKAHAERYQGREWSQINFDEAANVAEIRSIWPELMKEVRSPDPTVRCSGFASGNPSYAGHAFFKQHFVEPCGKQGGVALYKFELPDGTVVTRSRRFIPAKIKDNPVYANDKRYLATLMSLPLERRLALLDGDWDTGAGLALPQLDRQAHLIKPFEVPRYWTIVGGFDWGFAHRWVFCWAGITEDGDVVGIDTIRGRGDLAHEIAATIRRRCPLLGRMTHCAAGHDTWRVDKVRGDTTPKIAEALLKQGIPIVHANQDRVHGLNNLRSYTAWRRQGKNESDIEPGLRWMETDGNVHAFEQLQTIVVDPDDPEAPLKVDVDPDTGEGGDDDFDAWRYLMASRPARARTIGLDEQVKPWAPATLAYEADQSRRVRPTAVKIDDDVDPLVASEYVD